MFLKLARTVLLAAVLLALSAVPSHEWNQWSPVGMACYTSQEFLHVPVYVDVEFTQIERSVIGAGYDEWRIRTGGLVDLRIVGTTPHQFIFGRYFFGPTHSAYVYRVNEWEALAWNEHILGFTGFNAYMLVPSRFRSYQNMKSVSMHETGHMLGMTHTSYSRDLMFPYCLPDTCESNITIDGDLVQLCMIIREMKNNGGARVELW